MKGVMLWTLYNPLARFVEVVPPRFAMSFADLLGDVETQVQKRRNPGFFSYLEGIELPISTSEKRGLGRKCFRFRYRSFFSRILDGTGKYNFPGLRTVDLTSYDGRGVCFPLCHYGFFFLAFDLLASSLQRPLYSLSIMPEKGSYLEKQCIAKKRHMIDRTHVCPIYDVEKFKNECLPMVVEGKAGYVATFDTLSPRSGLRSILGLKVVLLIEPTARFALEHDILLVSFFTQGADIQSVSVELGATLDPTKTNLLTVADVEDWYVSVLEKKIRSHPEMVDWFFWWKRVMQFETFHK